MPTWRIRGWPRKHYLCASKTRPVLQDSDLPFSMCAQPPAEACLTWICACSTEARWLQRCCSSLLPVFVSSYDLFQSLSAVVYQVFLTCYECVRNDSSSINMTTFTQKLKCKTVKLQRNCSLCRQQIENDLGANGDIKWWSTPAWPEVG